MSSSVVESHKNHLSQPMVAICGLVVVHAVWGLTFQVMKSLNLHMEHTLDLSSNEISTQLRLAFSAGMIGLRFLFATILLSIFCPRLVRMATRAEWKAGCVVGLLFYFGLILQVMGLATIPASRSGFLTSLTAVFTPLFTAMLVRKFPSINVILGIVMALTGVSVLTGFFVIDQRGIQIASDAMSRWTLGDTLTTIGAVLFTGQLMLVDYYGSRLNTAAITPGMFLVVTIASLITFVSLHSLSLPANNEACQSPIAFWSSLFFQPIFFGIVCFLAVFCSIFAFLGMNKYQPYISAVQASVIYSTEPVFASIWALFLPTSLGLLASRFGYANEIVSLPLFLGGFLILLANIIALWPRQQKAPPVTA